MNTYAANIVLEDTYERHVAGGLFCDIELGLNIIRYATLIYMHITTKVTHLSFSLAASAVATTSCFLANWCVFYSS